MKTQYLKLRSPQVIACKSEYVDRLFSTMCEILDGREQLNRITITTANNIAFTEWSVLQLQEDVLDRGSIEEVENAGNIFFKPSKSLDAIRAMTLGLSKLYKDLRLLPEEVKELAESDEFLDFLKGRD